MWPEPPFFLSVFNTHQCISSIFLLLIATGKYLSTRSWQGSLRVLLKWYYTGPSTCNCVAAVQSWPLKGQAVIYLKWQQLHFYLPAEQRKKSSQHCTVSILTVVVELMPVPCIYMWFCESVATACCVLHSRWATSWTLSASCHHGSKLQRNGLCSQGLFTNPVKCSTAIDMAYLNKHGLYRVCRSFSRFWGCSLALAWALLHYINTNAHKNLWLLYWL